MSDIYRYILYGVLFDLPLAKQGCRMLLKNIVPEEIGVATLLVLQLPTTCSASLRNLNRAFLHFDYALFSLAMSLVGRCLYSKYPG